MTDLENRSENGLASTIRDDYRSIQEIVYTTLRDEILSGRLEPGSRLNTSEIAERLGVSRTPIREALNRLIPIGLVEQIPHRGAFVSKLSIEEIIEIYYIRASLEGIAARLAVQHLTQAEIDRLIELSAECMLNLTNEAYNRILEQNYEFHNIVYKAAQSPRLYRLIRQYYSLSGQYRALGLELPGRYGQVCEEHQNLARSLADRDPERAEFHAREHHLNTARRIAQSFGSNIQI